MTENTVQISPEFEEYYNEESYRFKDPVDLTISDDGEVQLVELEPGQIPKHWDEFLSRHNIKVLKLAMTFGLVIPGWILKDYLMWAVHKPGGGFETVNLWGKQGSKKSCRTCIMSHWIYSGNNPEDESAWDTVLKEMVLMPDAKDYPGYEQRGFIQKMKSIKKDDRAPLLSWDDVTVQMPSASFKTDVKQYAAVDSMFAAIRTKVSVILMNCPLIDRLGRNVKDNITLEVFIGPNQVELIERFVRLPGLKHLESNFFKVQVEPLHKFDYTYMPKPVFQEYFDIRLEIADFAVHKMGKAFGDEAEIMEEMLTIPQAAQKLGIAINTMTNYTTRGVIPSLSLNGRKYVEVKDVNELVKANLQNKR